MNKHIFLFRIKKLFGWHIAVFLSLDCLFELFIVYIKGRGDIRYSIQVSIFDIEIMGGKPDSIIRGDDTISGGNRYKTYIHNPKYKNDKVSGWSWSIRDGIEIFDL